MDDRRFDRLTAAVFSQLARRRLLGSVLGSTLATLLAGAAPTRAQTRKECRFGRPPCGGECCTLRETCKRKNGRRQCVHHCEDGKTNLGETDKDCGRVCDGALGRSPQGLCKLRKRCERGEDCKSGRCREPRPGEGKQCVECLTDAHCGPSATPRCLQGFCFECAQDDDCPGLASEPEEQFCVALDFQADPNDAPCPPNERCVCRECRQDEHCPAERPHCQTGTGTRGDGRCFECLENEHCLQGGVCNEDGECVPCARHADCAAGERCLSGGVCLAGCSAGCQNCGGDKECVSDINGNSVCCPD